MTVKKPLHPHAQWLGSDLACSICNPVCWQNHGFGKSMAFKDCGVKGCPNALNANQESKSKSCGQAKGSKDLDNSEIMSACSPSVSMALSGDDTLPTDRASNRNNLTKKAKQNV